MVIHRL